MNMQLDNRFHKLEVAMRQVQADIKDIKKMAGKETQNSLIERDKVELTGNELCLKLLSLDLDVMCDVKDGDYRLIFAHDGEFFISSNNDERERHKNVTPISSYGEPLTAADVGL